MIIQVFDYLLLALPGVAMAIWAQWRILRAYSAGSKLPAACGCTGAEVASAVLDSSGREAITIQLAAGELCQHYDASRKVLRLSPRFHDGRSLTALAVSAHEAGHALQEASGYRWLTVRNLVVPLASTGSQLLWLLILAGLLLGIGRLILAGVGLFFAMLFLQLVNLPVEFDATRRARLALTTTGMVVREEEPIVDEVMNAAAWIYVAATLTGAAGLIGYGKAGSH